MTSTALVGARGFVGSNLARSREFSDHFTSQNSTSIAGRHFNTVYFAAARAEKWRANQDPEMDLAHIVELMGLLSSFSADRLVLVSTVDVYDRPIGVDETSEIDESSLHPYGLHRLALEKHAKQAHEHVTIVRLPGLYGPGLKKNVIFDLLHANNVDRIHPDGSFQYYDIRNLSSDTDLAVANDLPLVNFVGEPVTTADVAAAAFDYQFPAIPAGPAPASYDVRTIHSESFGARGPYLFDRATTLEGLIHFVEQEKAK